MSTRSWSFSVGPSQDHLSSVVIIWSPCPLVHISQVSLGICCCQAGSGYPAARDQERCIGEDHSLLWAQSRLHRHQDPPLGPWPLSGHVPWNRQCHEECRRGGGGSMDNHSLIHSVSHSIVHLPIHYTHTPILFWHVFPSSGFRWWQWAGPLRRVCRRP